MPLGSEGIDPGLLGLALSGGGFRATLFHLGSLWRVNELALLPRLDRISSVSGGSILTGLLAVRWSRLTFQKGIATNFAEAIAAPARAFCSRSWDVRAILLGTLIPGSSASKRMEAAYRATLFGDATLQDLPDRPRFIFNTTNLATGVDFRLSKPYAGDYRVGLLDRPKIPVAFAVAASAGFPPFLSPARLSVAPDAFTKVFGADLYPDARYRTRLALTDGGAYDNLGLETIEKRCRQVLVSDAGSRFAPTPRPSGCWLSQTMRAFDIATEQARGARRRALVSDFASRSRPGAFWGIWTPIGDYGLGDALSVAPRWSESLSSLRTRLNAFSNEEQRRLVNLGYALADAAIRRYYLPGEPFAPARWPYADSGLDDDAAISRS